MSDVAEIADELLDVLHPCPEAHRGPPRLTCVLSSLLCAIVLILVASLGGCGGASSPETVPDGPPDSPPDVPAQVCHGRQPAPTATKACGCSADCEIGEDCADEALSGYPGGYCARGCANRSCPEGYACEELTAGDPGTRGCLLRCTTTTDCRQGYLCEDWVKFTADGVVEETVCMPHCSSSADCAAGTVCDPYYGLCGPRQHPGTGDIGALCAKNEDCISDFCLSGPQFPNGYCSAGCSVLAQDCPQGSACEYRLGRVGDSGVCLKSCTQVGNCRTGYSCTPGDLHHTSVCFASAEELDVVRTGAGSGTVTGGGISCGPDCFEVVTRGQVVTLTAVADAGSKFGEWSGCDTPSGATCTMSLDRSKFVVATFDLVARPATLTVTKSGTGFGTVDGGSISCGGVCNETVANGSSIKLTATPSSGATFTGWSGCDAASGTTCTMSMTANKIVTAIFGSHCMPNATRCVHEHPELQERCSTAGTWMEESCAPWKVCAANTCRAICGITSAPTDPTLCVVPIADGVNDGEWRYWTDPQVDPRTYVAAGTSTPQNTIAEIRPAPGEAWPFMWRLRVGDTAGAFFKLNQFGPFRHPLLGARTRRAGIQAGFSGFIIGMFGPTTTVGSCVSSATSTWAAGTCSAATPHNQSFDYAGGFNSMLLNIQRRNGTIDLLDVNYAYLTIAP
jgi:hypothetical protein